MPLAPPGTARRWAVVGRTPDHWECTTLIDLPDERAYLVVHLAAVSRHSLHLDRSSVRTLRDTIEAGAACAVPARHAVHGERLLGLRPLVPRDEPGPMELYLQLPDSYVAVLFRRRVMHDLATALTAALEELTDAR